MPREPPPAWGLGYPLTCPPTAPAAPARAGSAASTHVEVSSGPEAWPPGQSRSEGQRTALARRRARGRQPFQLTKGSLASTRKAQQVLTRLSGRGPILKLSRGVATPAENLGLPLMDSLRPRCPRALRESLDRPGRHRRHQGQLPAKG